MRRRREGRGERAGEGRGERVGGQDGGGGCIRGGGGCGDGGNEGVSVGRRVRGRRDRTRR